MPKNLVLCCDGTNNQFDGYPFNPPIHASIEGSLFFDGERTADQIAPAYHLKTTWEVHAISKITRL
jgi:hypothetical protein